jgi:hypothetical protein
MEPPVVPALGQPVASLTVAPRRYGWHGTLVPPFHIAEGYNTEHVVLAAKEWAKRIATFEAPLQAADLGRFVALRAAQLEHDGAIRDTEKRLAPHLTPRQRALLLEWGYPYVLDEFRFHMTLSDSIDSEAQRTAIRTLWQARSEALGPLPFHGAALFVQAHRDAPFSLWQRLPFGDAGARA